MMEAAMRSNSAFFALFSLAGALVACPFSVASDCRVVDSSGISYSVCRVNLAEEDLQIFYRDSAGAPFGTFNQVNKHLASKGMQLDFAMNGGMFLTSLEPVGLLVSEGKKVKGLTLANWPKFPPVSVKQDGNFYIVPNGVFWVKDKKAFITDSLAYDSQSPTPDLAIQSGPLLLKKSEMPPILDRYNKPSTNRNGVCVANAADTVIFVVSKQQVGIRQFAQFMKNDLHCVNALYLDGCRSALFSKQLERNDISCPTERGPGGTAMGQMIGTVTKLKR
jgi:uncharacterized protein YigE (DUF2233 family)